MKTTLYLDDRVAKAAKRHADTHGTTLTSVVNAALRQFLTKAREKGPAFELDLHVRDTGPQPGVDIEDRSSLHDLMDDR